MEPATNGAQLRFTISSAAFRNVIHLKHFFYQTIYPPTHFAFGTVKGIATVVRGRIYDHFNFWLVSTKYLELLIILLLSYFVEISKKNSKYYRSF